MMPGDNYRNIVLVSELAMAAFNCLLFHSLDFSLFLGKEKNSPDGIRTRDLMAENHAS
jgi:hypothetical protein